MISDIVFFFYWLELLRHQRRQGKDTRNAEDVHTFLIVFAFLFRRGGVGNETDFVTKTIAIENQSLTPRRPLRGPNDVSRSFSMGYGSGDTQSPPPLSILLHSKSFFDFPAFEMTDSFGLEAKPALIVAVDCGEVSSRF